MPKGTWIVVDEETKVRFKDGDVEFFTRQPDNQWRVVVARPISKEAVDGGTAPWHRITANIEDAVSGMARAIVERMKI